MSRAKESRLNMDKNDIRKEKMNRSKMNKTQKRFMKYAVGINIIMFAIILLLLWIFSRRVIALFK